MIDWADIGWHTALVAAAPCLAVASVYIVMREVKQNGWPLPPQSFREAFWPLYVCWPIYIGILIYFWRN